MSRELVKNFLLRTSSHLFTDNELGALGILRLVNK